MAHRTTADRTLPRSELAASLATLSEEFGSDAEEITIDVGNRSISLTPADEVDFSLDVIERSSLLHSSRKTVEIELSWSP
ncbi:amphi-Trp domain-containing protein [Haloterrigena alkaliphila]|uniref:Amphi-Trp domain-containing protein n=1 Tax=Haloterrigena alkaliphila TaxID=2816475 RepID=A0A8A2VKB3_9EURY|nr:amphi-Trp domain-containing protein [Haloterrigena alkaliphila]QSX01068.1 amphi-Trp domain-containing protein [Haloterrigena alkaliphila]